MKRVGPRQFTIANILCLTFTAACYLAYFRADTRTQFYELMAFFAIIGALIAMAIYWAITRGR